MKYYKFTEANGVAHGYHWPLPTKNEDGTWTPGKWTRKIADIVMCEKGYHFTDETGVSGWIDAELYEVEYQGEFVCSNDIPVKYVCHKARLLRKIEVWDERTQRLFAVWCAREALKLVKKPDPRSVSACDVAERYANGEATKEELEAEREAAWAAAGAAERAAAGDAAGAAGAAWAAAGDAAREAQSKKLREMVGEV